MALPQTPPNTLTMNSRPTALERAFELARSGAYENLTALRRVLEAEGHSRRLIEGRALIRQLNDICKASAASPPTAHLPSPDRPNRRE